MIGSRAWLAGIALTGVGAVGAALVSQHFYGMQPCPWCVLQRLIFLAISAAAVLALALGGWVRRVALVLLVLLTGCGAAAALWQHFVSANSASCNLTLADRIVGGMQLDAHWPEVFMATASCADAKVDLFGLPYEAWSLALFALMGAVAVRLLLPRHAPELQG
ncbi:MAG: disulfide bond formation protein B [Rubrivivax sp.]